MLPQAGRPLPARGIFSVISITNNWCSCPPSIRQEKRTMEPFVTMGLVLKETRYREADRILTILTPKLGVITAIAANSLRLKSKLFSACGLFCYSEFTLVPGRNMYTVRSVNFMCFVPFDCRRTRIRIQSAQSSARRLARLSAGPFLCPSPILTRQSGSSFLPDNNAQACRSCP